MEEGKGGFEGGGKGMSRSGLTWRPGQGRGLIWQQGQALKKVHPNAGFQAHLSRLRRHVMQSKFSARTKGWGNRTAS
eukprot:234517-Chlamydomonas_euryale.AAC.3